jgi:hypothetical protein
MVGVTEELQNVRAVIGRYAGKMAPGRVMRDGQWLERRGCYK